MEKKPFNPLDLPGKVEYLRDKAKKIAEGRSASMGEDISTQKKEMREFFLEFERRFGSVISILKKLMRTKLTNPESISSEQMRFLWGRSYLERTVGIGGDWSEASYMGFERKTETGIMILDRGENEEAIQDFLKLLMVYQNYEGSRNRVGFSGVDQTTGERIEAEWIEGFPEQPRLEAFKSFLQKKGLEGQLTGVEGIKNHHLNIEEIEGYEMLEGRPIVVDSIELKRFE